MNGIEEVHADDLRGARPVAAAISVIDSDDVLLARIACGFASLSSLANSSTFRSMLSGTASTIEVGFAHGVVERARR